MSLIVNDVKTAEDLYVQIKSTIRQSFARLYAALKARELQTLRQFQAVHSHCESSHSHLLECLQSIQISYDIEPTILKNISQYGNVKLEGVNLEGHTFLVEDYVNPNEDHMYSYKDIDEVSDQIQDFNLDIEEAALRQITSTESCVCSVNFTNEEIHKRFNHDYTPRKLQEIVSSEEKKVIKEHESTVTNEKIKEQSDNKRVSNKTVQSIDDSVKTNPAYEWLNCIKTQTETEPAQVNDVMEYSKIKC